MSFDAARLAVEAYYDGEWEIPLSIPIHQTASAFRLRAWTALRSIPAGHPITYADLAARAGSPLAVRAAGSACATNPAALFQPCHRVLRTGGALGGFGFGLDVKQALLTRESTQNLY
jgi:methylated-DNA-[protein]-cysteine S-methyltransferase